MSMAQNAGLHQIRGILEDSSGFIANLQVLTGNIDFSYL